MTALTLKVLDDYPFKRVEEVRQGNVVLGLIENEKDCLEWKAFVGSGFSCRYLAKYYSRCAAVRAVQKAAAILYAKK